jgi:hypothetical protein
MAYLYIDSQVEHCQRCKGNNVHDHQVHPSDINTEKDRRQKSRLGK